MRNYLTYPHLLASFITPAARRWLKTTQSARILSNFDRACNLVNQDATVLALVTSDRGLTPFGLVITSPDPTPFASLQPDSPVTLEGTRLSIGDLLIETDHAVHWSPSPNWASIRTLFSTNPDRLLQLAALALDNAPSGSLLDLYSPESSHAMQGLLSRIRPNGMKLVEGLKTDNEALCLEGVKGLAGLGGGLTPAGDDFIVGVLLAAWAGLYGERSEGRGQMFNAIASTAASLTTTLSAAYLKSAAAGECIDHWHRLFAALDQPDVDVLAQATKSLMSIGHTSGADGLAGFLAVQLLGD
jgi:hypothetical protein